MGSMGRKGNREPAGAGGRHFLQIPGPTNVPERVLRALSRPTIDHRGPEFANLARDVLTGLKSIFQTQDHVVIYPSSVRARGRRRS
jgi:alanine-glyoxylate transaminase / serine-glyoxylate transaminase / serine-pyruvate transaminase